MRRCRINNDDWADASVEYLVHHYVGNYGTTGVNIRLEAPDGTITDRVVASHQIEWIEDEG